MTTSPNSNSTRAAFARGYLRGREDERAQASIAIMTLKAALNQALSENHDLKLHLNLNHNPTLTEAARKTTR